MKADAQTEAAVKAVLMKLADAYAQRDIQALLALLSPGPDNLMIAGPGAYARS
jgi:hypothetical protein